MHLNIATDSADDFDYCINPYLATALMSLIFHLFVLGIHLFLFIQYFAMQTPLIIFLIFMLGLGYF